MRKKTSSRSDPDRSTTTDDDQLLDELARVFMRAALDRYLSKQQAADAPDRQEGAP